MKPIRRFNAGRVGFAQIESYRFQRIEIAFSQ